MRRRDFIALLGGAAAAWPLAALAQQPKAPVVGFLSGAAAWEYAHLAAAFRQGLADASFVEGRNVLVEYRWAEGHYDRLLTLAAELVSRPVAVIVLTGGTAAALAAKAATPTTPIVFANGSDPVKFGLVEYRWADDQYDRLPALAMELAQRRVAVLAAAGSPAALPAKAATTVIPIVFMIGSDPVELGLVASLNRPGGNLTGVAYLNVEVAPKRLELLHELVPSAKSIALLVNPANPVVAEAQAKELQAAVSTLGLHLQIVNASNPIEIEDAFATIVRDRVEVLQIGVDPLFGNHVDQLVALAAHHKVPTIYPWREFTAAGGLMNYGSSIPDAFRQVGVYTGQILKGAKPADLPVRRPSKLQFVLNLKAAKALGLEVPTTVLARADEVIE